MFVAGLDPDVPSLPVGLVTAFASPAPGTSPCSKTVIGTFTVSTGTVGVCAPAFPSVNEGGALDWPCSGGPVGVSALTTSTEGFSVTFSGVEVAVDTADSPAGLGLVQSAVVQQVGCVAYVSSVQQGLCVW